MTVTRALALGAAAALLAAPALSSCGVNFSAQTDQVYTPTDGENAREGTVDVLHALIVSDSPGSGRLIAALVNGDSEQDDRLERVQGIEGSAGVTFSIVEGETTIPAGGALQLADDDAANVVATGDPEVLTPGGFVRLSMTFANGESTSINVPVLAPGEDYADIELPTGGSSSGDSIELDPEG